MNKLRVYRKKELNNKRRPFKVFFNDEFIGKIEYNVEYKDFLIESSEGNLKIGIDWCSSNSKKVKFRSNESIKKYIVSSSISNLAFLGIVLGSIFSVVLFFIFRHEVFILTPLILTLYPIWLISLGRKSYLKLNPYD